MTEHVLITGGTGFIGSRLARACVASGDSVRVLGQENTDAERSNATLLRDQGVEVLLRSVSDDESLDELLRGVTVVYHLAAAQHEANIPDERFEEVNVRGTRRLLDAAATAGVKRFVHGSTIGVYGVLDGTIDENSPCNPDNIYGRTKLAGEREVLSAATRLPVSVIRISETYGPGDRRLLKLFNAINKKMFFMIGSGRNLHHLIYVDDLVDGMRLAATAPGAVGEVFLLAGPEPLSTRAMVDTIASGLQRTVRRFAAPMWPFMTAAVVLETVLKPLGIQPPLHRRRMDFFRKSFSISRDKSSTVLGFTPDTSFADGVAHTARWYRENSLLSGERSGDK